MSFVLIMGGISMKPAVFDGNIVPRRIITLSVAPDHRVADAWHEGKLFRYLKRIINNPVVLEESLVTMQGNTPL